MVGAETMQQVAAVATDKNLAIALTMMVGPAFAALSIGLIGSKTTEAIGRNPEAASKVQTAMILTAAFAEAIAI